MHDAIEAPAAWVQRWAGLVPACGRVLDVACGHGRHARFFAARGHAVDAVDRNAAALEGIANLANLTNLANIRPLCADIEAEAWPYPPHVFSAVVVTNYLHRPLFPVLLDALAPGGVLIYETFALGNERFGRPSNPDFLLQPGELLEIVRERLRVVAYEDLVVETPRAACVQRVVAVYATNGQ